eukprot:evm.model.NODE_10154_length_4284_cov_20.161299.1
MIIIISKGIHLYEIRGERAALVLPGTRSHLQHTTNVFKWLARVLVLQHSQGIGELVRQDLDQAGDILPSLMGRRGGREEADSDERTPFCAHLGATAFFQLIPT